MKHTYPFSHPNPQPIIVPADRAGADGLVHLTRRQRDVLAELAHGHSTKVICRTLGLSEGTIKVHLAALMRSFQARNRTELVVAAMRQGHLVIGGGLRVPGAPSMPREVSEVVAREPGGLVGWRPGVLP